LTFLLLGLNALRDRLCILILVFNYLYFRIEFINHLVKLTANFKTFLNV